MQRITVFLSILVVLAACQSPSIDALPTHTALVVTPTDVVAQAVAPPQRDTSDEAMPIVSTPTDADTQATPTKRRLRLGASATSIKTNSVSSPIENQPSLQFELVPGVNDDKSCIFVLVSGVDVSNWMMQIDGGQLAAFTQIGSAFVCGLQAEQAVTFTLLDANGAIVPGAQSIAARGGDAFYAKLATGRIDTPDVNTNSTRGLRFRLDNADGNQRCIVVRVTGIAAEGWLVKGDGLKVSMLFDAAGTAELCGLNRRQEFTFSVYDAKEMAVAGGTGIPARGGDVFVAEWGDIAGIQAAATATPAPTSNRALRVSLKNSDDDPRCISIQISGIRTNGWTLKADGLKLSANFDGAGNARLCGLKRQQEFTFSVFDAKGGAVAGGRGIPARGSNIFVAEWR